MPSLSRLTGCYMSGVGDAARHSVSVKYDAIVTPRLQGRDQHRHRRCGLCGTSGHVLIRTGDVTLSNLAVNGEPVTETTTLAPGAALSGIRLLNVLDLGDYDATAHVTAIRDGAILGTLQVETAIHVAEQWNLGGDAA